LDIPLNQGDGSPGLASGDDSPEVLKIKSSGGREIQPCPLSLKTLDSRLLKAFILA